MKKMTFLDFFAGIGTIRIGFEQAGWECNGHVEWDKFAQASYNAMHDTKDGEFNGWDIRSVRADELPQSDLWAFGAPCQDFSIAGKRKGMDGERSSLVNEIFRLIEETPEENKPTWLLYENVKGMLSSNGGWDFLGIILEMDRLGYDVEWQMLNSKHFGVPQNRERVFTLGHLRGRGGRKVFPIAGQSGQAAGDIKVLGRLNLPGKDQCNRIYSADHLSPSLTTMQGGRQEPKIAIPVSSPDYQTKNQNGRRFKEDGDPMFTLTAQDVHGVMVDAKSDYLIDGKNFNQRGVVHGTESVSRTLISSSHSGNEPKVTDGFRIRKLTPKECWRLQGIPDYYFDKASAVNSDSQLYKQAGNACTVNVLYAIAKRIQKSTAEEDSKE